jgi:hypothetical protein
MSDLTQKLKALESTIGVLEKVLWKGDHHASGRC